MVELAKAVKQDADSLLKKGHKKMERLTIPDEKIDGGMKRTCVDGREVKKHAMTLYWALKKYEDTGLTPEQVHELKERYTKKKPDENGCPEKTHYKCPNCVEKIIRSHMDEVKNDDWIPVEERLPNQNGVYNVTRLIDDAFISDSVYFDGQDTWHNDNRVNHTRPYLTDIVAWQPLPNPYIKNPK